ncbi:MAG: class I SAM-dependent methyltransferase, partial [Verrucomicrobiota bacterium]
VEYQNYQYSQLMKELASSAHREEYRGQTSSAIYSEISTRIKMMSLPPGSRILDAGCGIGAFSLPLAAEFSFFVDGIDLGEELTKRAAKLAFEATLAAKCRFFTGDFANLSTYPTDLFDAVICVGSLYWGQSLSTILDIWHRITRPGAQLLIFLNLEYTPLNSDEKEAIGETQFFSSLMVEYELSQHRWALCEWSDATTSYIEWLQRWCHKMEELSLNLSIEMGKDKAFQLIRRFTTYLTLAQKQAVRRIILRAEHV